MALIGKRSPGACPGHTWEDETTVHDVEDGLAAELLRIQDADFFDATAEGLTPKSRRGQRVTEPGAGPDPRAVSQIQDKIDRLKAGESDASAKRSRRSPKVTEPGPESQGEGDGGAEGDGGEASE